MFDPGYADTAAYHSAITFVDGEAGRLFYRGYPVEQLATSFSFLEIAYLLIYGELPSPQASEEFVARVRGPKLVLHVGIERLFDSFPQSMHPMAMLAIATEALSARTLTTAPSPTTAPPWSRQGYGSYRRCRYSPAMPSRRCAACPGARATGRSITPRTLLQLCFAIPGSEHLPDNATARALNTLLILHADHELNCSTATLRMVASSGAGFYAGVSAAINALWGPLHGGANQEVIKMLQEIKDSGQPLSHFVDKAKDRNDPFRLMGFGHRVYKTTDARAKVIRQIALDLVEKRASNDPLLDIALRLEEVALADDFFISRRLYPNVDFYSGHHLPGDRVPRRDVHPPFRRRAHRRLGRPLARADDLHRQPHRPADADLHGPAERPVPAAAPLPAVTTASGPRQEVANAWNALKAPTPTTCSQGRGFALDERRHQRRGRPAPEAYASDWVGR